MAEQLGWPAGRRRMPATGTTIVFDPDDLQASLREVGINLLVTRRGRFRACVTRVELPRVHLIGAEENLSRIAHLSLTGERILLVFSTRPHPPQVWGGLELGPLEFVLHWQSERIHQRTSGASHWGLISLAPEHFAAHGKALTGSELVPSPLGLVLRPSRSSAARLRYLHRQACQLADTKPCFIAHREVARALENDVLDALVDCLTTGVAEDHALTRRRHADIMNQFEDVLAVHLDGPLHMSELCAIVGVPERTLRGCCAEFLGMSPIRYIRLRRLNLVRAALRGSDPAATTVADIARRYGFSELGRLAADYRTIFGETPSATLRRGKSRTGHSISAESA